MGDLNIFNRNDGSSLTSRDYTNGISQKQAIEEIKKHFADGKKIVILSGGPGSGKSIVGLEVINDIGDGYITVPRIYHQDQYRKDYSDEDSRVFMKDGDGEQVNIQTLKGKGNFECINVDEKTLKDHPESKFCDWSRHICNGSKDVASKFAGCKHYMTNRPIFPGVTGNPYDSISGVRMIDYNPKVETCRYHQDFKDSIRNNIVIINSKKLEVECAIGRLPKKKVLVVDEFDIFLKELSSPKKIDFSRAIRSIRKALRGKLSLEKDEKKVLEEIKTIMKDEQDVVVKNWKIVQKYKNKVFRANTEEFKQSAQRIKRLFELFQSEEFLQEIRGLNNVYKTLAYCVIAENDMNFYYTIESGKFTLMLFGLDISSIVSSIFDSFDHVLLMSATRQNDKILSTFFGIDEYELVKTEESVVGTMFNVTLGCETSFKRTLLEKGEIKEEHDEKERQRHLLATGRIIKRTREFIYHHNPIRLKRLFHISAFGRLPEAHEMDTHDGLRELGTKLEDGYDEKDLFKAFQDPSSDVYLHKSTKMFRAIDLPQDKCRVVIFQKLPFPLMTPFHTAIGQKYGEDFKWDMLNDECQRELIQGATRGIRDKDDWCIVCSPDSRVNGWIKRIFYYNQRVQHLNYPHGQIIKN